MKTQFTTIAAAVAIAMSTAASAQFNGNDSSIYQAGERNENEITQAGNYNASRVDQIGTYNETTVRQYSLGNEYPSGR